MEQPPTKYDLDFLEDVPGAIQLVTDFLEAIVKHHEHHENRFIVSPVWEGDRRPVRTGTSYRLAEKHGLSIIANPQRLPSDITGKLLVEGWIEPEPNRQYAHDPKRFTEKAFAWYEQFGGPSDDEVRKRIGRLLQGHVGKPIPPFYSVEEVAAAIDVPPNRVYSETHMLIGAGLAHQKRSADSEFGALGLTEPEGIRWAAAGFPPIGTIGVFTANVALDLRVEVRSIIEQVRHADVDPVLLEQFEARLRRLEEELEKPDGEGNFERVKDVVSSANTTREFLEQTIPFLMNHWPKIQAMADAVGNMLP
jgi:hypothetical protein